MTKSWRSLVSVVLLVVAAAIGASAHAARVDVVKIMNFTCSFCLASEGPDKLVEAAASSTGGRFVRAPVPLESTESGAKERVYYAARDMSEALAEKVKSSIYKGAQESQVNLDGYVQVYTWLLQDIPEQEASFNELFKRAQDPSTKAALNRAIALIAKSGVEQVPTYVVLKNGAIDSVYDTRAGESVQVVRQNLIQKIQQLSKE